MKYAYKGKEIHPVVETGTETMAAIANIPLKDFFFVPDRCVEAWKIATPILADYFGELLKPRTPSGPYLSYCHLHEIGAKLGQPEDSEPNVVPFAKDIDEAIAILKDNRGMEFCKNDFAKIYMETNRLLQEAFPEHNIPLLAGYSAQGIITSAVLMRGQDFYLDLYDEPEKTAEFLDLMTESIVNFKRTCAKIQGFPEVSPNCVTIGDDFASLVPPYMWPDYVVPYWNKFFEGLTSGKERFVHCEDMQVPHLKYLNDVKVTTYQPSVSDKLTIKSIKENIDIPFDWLLYSWVITGMSDEEIQSWVDDTIEQGVASPRTQFDGNTWRIGKMDRMLAFFKAFEKYRVE